MDLSLLKSKDLVILLREYYQLSGDKQSFLVEECHNRLFKIDSDLNIFKNKQKKVSRYVSIEMNLEPSIIMEIVGHFSAEDINFYCARKSMNEDGAHIKNFCEFLRIHDFSRNEMRDCYDADDITSEPFFSSFVDIDLKSIENSKVRDCIGDLKKICTGIVKAEERIQNKKDTEIILVKKIEESEVIDLDLSNLNSYSFEEACKKFNFLSDNLKAEFVQIGVEKYFHTINQYLPYETFMYVITHNAACGEDFLMLLRNICYNHDSCITDTQVFLKEIENWYFGQELLSDLGWMVLKNYILFMRKSSHLEFCLDKLELLYNSMSTVLIMNPGISFRKFLEQPLDSKCASTFLPYFYRLRGNGTFLAHESTHFDHQITFIMEQAFIDAYMYFCDKGQFYIHKTDVFDATQFPTISLKSECPACLAEKSKSLAEKYTKLFTSIISLSMIDATSVRDYEFPFQDVSARCISAVIKAKLRNIEQLSTDEVIWMLRNASELDCTTFCSLSKRFIDLEESNEIKNLYHFFYRAALVMGNKENKEKGQLDVEIAVREFVERKSDRFPEFEVVFSLYGDVFKFLKHYAELLRPA